MLYIFRIYKEVFKISKEKTKKKKVEKWAKDLNWKPTAVEAK